MASVDAISDVLDNIIHNTCCKKEPDARLCEGIDGSGICHLDRIWIDGR